MDINDIRSALTVTGLILFLALWRWAWAARRKGAFDEAARLPFAGDAGPDGHDGGRGEGAP